VRKYRLTAICTPLYPCKRWNCNNCFSNRVYWLREQAVAFASQTTNNNFYFYTFKGFKDATSASQYASILTTEIKRANRRYNTKKHYFFVIAKHNRSNWHIHLIYNAQLLIPVLAHVEPVKDLKLACLYLVLNLEKSRFQDYQRVRRYSASRLLNTNNKKQVFRTRRRLWRIRTLQSMVAKIIKVLSSRVPDNRKPIARTSDRCTRDTTTVQPPTPHKTRPPPRNKTNNSLVLFFTFHSEGG